MGESLHTQKTSVGLAGVSVTPPLHLEDFGREETEWVSTPPTQKNLQASKSVGEHFFHTETHDGPVRVLVVLHSSQKNLIGTARSPVL